MTCYFRHVQEIFKKAGIVVTNDNKREIDQVIHQLVGIAYKNCPDSWKEVKKRITMDEAGFVTELKKAWNVRART